MKNFIAVLFCFVFFIITIKPAEPSPSAITVNETTKKKLIGKSMEYLEDKDGSLSLNEVMSNKFSSSWITSDKGSTGFGFTESIYWVRFTIENIDNGPIEMNLEQVYPLIDYLNLYMPGEGTCKKIETGDMLPFDARPVKYRTFIFPLQLKGKAKNTYYLRYRTQSSMNIEPVLWSLKEFKEHSEIEYRILFMIYAIIAVMALYNLMLFFIIKRPEYIYYVILILLINILWMCINGTAYQYLWPNYPWWGNLCLPLVLGLLTMSLLLFFYEFVNLRSLKDRGKKLILRASYYFSFGMIYFNTAIIPATIFMPYRISMSLTTIFTFIIFIFICTSGTALIILEKNRPAMFGLTAGAFIIVGNIAFILKTLGVLPSNLFTEWSTHMGLIIMVVLFSIALADRINTLRKELALLNATLEEKVKERTEELLAANEELESMNTALIQTNSRLEEAQRIAKKDMDMAANVQASLFPKTAPETKDWDIAFAFKPKSGVSGDLYDFYEDKGILKGISLFDVSGHGIASGLITMIARTVFYRNFTNIKEGQLNEILKNSNKNLINEIGSVSNYLTGILLRFNGSQVEYVNAAHCDLICKKAVSGKVEVVNYKDKDIKGYFLGIDMMDKDYDIMKFSLDKDDILLLHTDALNESKNTEGEEYGIDRIKESLNNSKGSSREILDKVMGDLYSFSGEDGIKDDLTVIVLRKQL